MNAEELLRWSPAERVGLMDQGIKQSGPITTRGDWPTLFDSLVHETYPLRRTPTQQLLSIHEI